MAAQNVRPDQCVTNALQSFRLDPNAITRNNEILKNFLDNLIQVMKNQDPHFKALFQKIYYTGSYYEKLRISEPNEFDINLILKLPFPPNVREIQSLRGVKSFVKYKLQNQRSHNEMLQANAELIKLFFEGEYLSPSQVRYWMQSLVDRALRSPEFRIPPGVKKIKPSASGPARTIKLEIDSGNDIDIDLVPVIQFSHPEWPSGARKNIITDFQVSQENQFWFLVPKDFSQSGNEVSIIEVKRLWRIHFPEIEKAILHHRGCVKPIIKFLKGLRDKENWQILASYYLKTIVLWLVEKNIKQTNYWQQSVMYDRLIECLECLKDSLRQRRINYYFYPSYNLIEKISGPQADNICNRLERIIRDFKANPQNIESFFTTNRKTSRNLEA